MKITHRKDGTITIRTSGPAWMCKPTKYDPGERFTAPEMIEYRPDHYAEPTRYIRPGDVGCLVVVSNDRTGQTYGFLYGNHDGFPGNSGPTVYRLHGWRGTFDDASCFAHGLRRVESIMENSRGVGWTVTLSKDLMPDKA